MRSLDLQHYSESITVSEAVIVLGPIVIGKLLLILYAKLDRWSNGSTREHGHAWLL